jgi:hypothetical protein
MSTLLVFLIAIEYGVGTALAAVPALLMSFLSRKAEYLSLELAFK